MGLITNLIEQHIETKHRDEEQRKAALRKFYNDRINDDSTPPEVREQLSQDYFKLLSPEAKKSAQKGFGLVQGLKKAFGGGQQQQPSPNGKLAGPQQQQGQPQAQPQQAAQPAPQGGTKLSSPQFAPGSADKAPGIPTALNGAQGAEAKPQPAPQPAAKLSSPTTPMPQQAGGLPAHLFPTAEEIAAKDKQKTEQSEALKTLETNERIREKKAEELGKEAFELKKQAQRDEQAKAFRATLTPEQQKHFDTMLGSKEFLGNATALDEKTAEQKKNNIHVQLKSGDWIPAEESPDGKITKMDGSPVDPKDIVDVNKTGQPPPPKYTGELGERVNAQKVVDDKSIPETAPEKKAARATLKSLDQKAKAVEARIEQGSKPSTITDEEFRALAQRQMITGEKPGFGLGKSADRDRYNKVYAEELLKDPDSAAARAAYKAGTANLTQLSKIRGQIGSFEDAFQADLKNAREAATSVPRSSVKLYNNWQQLAKANLEDSPELAAFRVATQTAINQYARLMFSATGGGTSTDSARAHAEDLLNAAMASGAYEAALTQMNKEAKNRTKGLDDEIEKQRKGLGSPSPNGKLNGPTSGEPKIKIISVQ
jgi:hypothetical protein